MAPLKVWTALPFMFVAMLVTLPLILVAGLIDCLQGGDIPSSYGCVRCSQRSRNDEGQG